MSDQTGPIHWRQHVTRLADGTELVRLLPDAVVPARPGQGMAIIDCITGDTGVIVTITREQCLYETSAGQRVSAAWACVCLTAVQPGEDSLR
ncbi:MAG: hypothetical protein WD009_05290 [Phycisphaeraceae bacterium]